MSNYRRLISYIYAYEGGIKGKNIGFAKIEARSGQCKIYVNVKKVYVGNHDMGVYLLAGNDQILIGKIFIRGGAGEFRTAVVSENVENSEWSIEQCFGLTIHSVEDSWRSYTTIWEDAVTQAAELTNTHDATQQESYAQAEQQAKQESYAQAEQQMQQASYAQEGQQARQASYAQAEQQMRQASYAQAGQQAQQASYVQAEPPESPLKLGECDIVKHAAEEELRDLTSENLAEEAIKNVPGSVIPQETGNRETFSHKSSIVEEIEAEIEAQSQAEEAERSEDTFDRNAEIVKNSGNADNRPKSGSEAENRLESSSEVENRPKSGSEVENRPESGSAAENRLKSGSEVENRPESGSAAENRPESGSEAEDRSKSLQEVEDRERLLRLEQEEIEAGQSGRLWQHFRKTYPKIQAFDYANGCEILTIKPQDIGLLPRETWTYGNNSFLLHGYYSYRYLILVKLNNPQGAPRYLLGVPGHYYSNEKYMASMFGFPNFVLSKMQPAGDVRFGYWYTDINMGNQ